MVRKVIRCRDDGKGEGKKGGEVMGSTLAALAISAVVGTGAPGSTAQASIAPEESSGVVKSYRIRPGSMAAALNDLADANGLHVLFDADLALGLRTKGLKGRHSLRAALDRLLAGTNLTYRLSDNRRTVLITLAQAATGTQTDARPVTLPTIDVNATQQGYTVTNSSSGTKTNTPIFQTPVSIQVVPAEVIEDQKAFRVQDALENVSGVQPRGSLGGFRERYIVRGFNVQENFYRNGLRVTSSGFTSNFQTADIDRIEVMKGGGSVLYGRGEPSGSILFWTKLPTNRPLYWLEQNFGSFGYYRTQWDVGAPVTPDGSFAYRFSGAYTNSQSFRDFGKSNSIVVYPSFMWRLTPSTEVTLGIEYVNQNFLADYGIPALGNLPAPVPISRSFQDPSDPIDNNNNVNVDYALKHQINDTWTVVNRFLASFRQSNNIDIAPFVSGNDVGSLNPNAFILNRQATTQHFEQASYATNLDFLGNFNIFDTKHQALVGLDYFNDQATYYFGVSRFTPGGIFPINIYAPIYGLSPAIFNNVPAQGNSDTLENWFGVYFQDQITIWDKLHIMGGGRQDWVEVKGLQYLTNTPPTQQNVSAFSPRVGALYELFPWLAVYGNWSQTFGANNGLDANGRTLAPQTGEEYEVGLKGQSIDQRLQATLAFYNITKQNVSTPDLRFPGGNVNALIGEVRSRGAELDIAGRIMDGLDAIVAFAYTDALILVDGSGNQGTSPPTGCTYVRTTLARVQFSNGFVLERLLDRRRSLPR
jgi:iron complex outermembrane receptor protein